MFPGMEDLSSLAKVGPIPESSTPKEPKWVDEDKLGRGKDIAAPPAILQFSHFTTAYFSIEWFSWNQSFSSYGMYIFI